MPLEPGDVLNNRYRIVEIIAQGGMGAIYKATDESLGMQVALKENLFSTEEYSRQFRREATILAGLRHPNLPRVTDHFVRENQGQYLIMDFIEGEDLRSRIARLGTLPEEEVVLIGASICEALAYLENREPPIVHRDIKPGNIKITPSGQIVLVDFGLAKMAHAGQATTIGAQALTPGYAPPEQYGKGTDPRSDIYALGATLYAALTGKIPEDGLSRAMGSATLTPIRKYNAKVSDRLAAVISKAMDVDSAQRYQNGTDFKLALLNTNTGARKKLVQTTDSRPAPSLIKDPTRQVGNNATVILPDKKSEPAGNFPATAPRQRPGWLIPVLAVGLVGLAAIILAGVIFGKNLFPAAIPATPTQLESTATQVEPTTVSSTQPAAVVLTVDATATSSPEPIQIPTLTIAPTNGPTPVGSQSGEIAFVSDRSGIPQIWMMKSNGGNVQQITKLNDGACEPSWSPDGQKLVIVSPCRKRQDEYRGSSLFIINADGSGINPIPSKPGGDYDPAWSPDGKQIAFSSVRDGNARIFLVDVGTMSATAISPKTSPARRPAWSPDGKTIAFETNRLGVYQIWTMDSDGKNAREFSILANGVGHMPTWSPDGQVIVFCQGGDSPFLVARQVGDPTAKEFRISDEANPVADPAYSPDGYWLLFEDWRSGNHNLFLMTPNGSNLTNLTNDTSNDFQAVWRP